MAPKPAMSLMAPAPPAVRRVPTRSALTALQRSGLVVVLPKRGSFVFQPSLADAAALCEYRFLLEREGLRLSYAAARAGTLAAIRASCSALS